MGERLRSLATVLGYGFRDPALLERALTHRSRAHEHGTEPAVHYERLEFLGDAVLAFVVADRLYRDDEQAAEGALSRRRQAVVRTSALAEAARRMGLGRALRLGRGEEQTGGREKTGLLADVFEAVLGAVYLDGGIRPARAFVQRHLGPALRAVRALDEAGDDYKTRLQERIQARLQRTPRYRIVSRTGPDHALEFTVEVLLGETLLGRGRGTNRKRAEQQAACAALQRLDETDEA